MLLVLVCLLVLIILYNKTGKKPQKTCVFTRVVASNFISNVVNINNNRVGSVSNKKDHIH